MEAQSNDLVDFMYTTTKEIASEYERIQKRSKDDPGTAGDQGEENWAEILRNWLPKDYQVVTKGRLMNAGGLTSPQVDIIVLKPFYPEYLLNKKLYLTAGVVAAFECKNTLKGEHITKLVKTSIKIRSLLPSYGGHYGNYTKELNSPIIYGLLSHSHIWKSSSANTEEIIGKRLLSADEEYVKHPRECIDIICVSDLATWYSFKSPMSLAASKEWPPPKGLPSWVKIPTAGYSIVNNDLLKNKLTPIGVMLANLYSKLAIYDTRLKDFSYYFSVVIGGSSTVIANSRKYGYDIFSDDAKQDLELNKLEYQKRWYNM